MRHSLTAVFSALLAGQTVSAEPPVDPVILARETAALQRLFSWDLALMLPAPDFKSGDWRSWAAPDKPAKQVVRSRAMPGATVEVVDRFVDVQKERVLELNASWAPVLARSFQLGWQSPYTGQMLSEFMGMYGANFRPPTIPSVFYNGLIPYWVQQGMTSPTGSSGIHINVSSEPRHMMLYPGRR